MATEQACFHCGQPVKDAGRWTVLINNKAEPLCCPACQAVAEAIIAGGLENYYRFRTQLAPKADDKRSGIETGFFAFDQSDLIHQDEKNNKAEIQLYVEGIHCAACCWLIEHALQKKTGVDSVVVSLATHKAMLRWDTTQHKLSDLLQCIHDIGYHAVPYQQEWTQEKLKQENRQHLLRLGIAGIGMMQAMMFALALYSGDFSGMEADYKQFMRVFALLVSLPVIFYSALPFYKSAWRSIKSFHVGMDVPISLALMIAFVASVDAVLFRRGEVYFDSISMFVFLLLLARFLENRARSRFLLPATSLLPLSCECLPDPAHASGFKSVAIDKITAGDVIRVKAGESIPLDGVVMTGNSSVNEAAFSGEQHTVAKKLGSEVFAGTINGDGVLTIRVTSTAGHTRLDMISRLAEWSLALKPRVSVLADQWASAFTLAVLGLAAAVALYWQAQGSAQTLAIVLSVLVISCPCALSLATPSALACSFQALRKNGLLVNSANIIEQTRHISHVIFDKTGTLTHGQFVIAQTQLMTHDKTYSLARISELAAALEHYSEHPIASAFSSVATDMALTDVHVFSGKGVEGFLDGECYRIGAYDFCAELGGSCDVDKTAMVYLVKQKQWLASFYLIDEVRPDAKTVVAQLQQMGKQVEILSGDSSGVAEQLAHQLNIDVCRSAMNPEQKLDRINTLQAQGHRVLMVGDGINDIPVLAKANVSIAMNNASDLAKIRADAILLGTSLMPIVTLLRHSAKTRGVIKQNIGWALLYNGLALPLAAMGLVAPWQAALGMSTSSLWVTFNSLRLRNP